MTTPIRLDSNKLSSFLPALPPALKGEQRELLTELRAERNLQEDKAFAEALKSGKIGPSLSEQILFLRQIPIR